MITVISYNSNIFLVPETFMNNIANTKKTEKKIYIYIEKNIYSYFLACPPLYLPYPPLYLILQ